MAGVIVFDLTINAGGSQDLMQAIIGMVTGDVVFSGYNELTKQKIHANVVTDRNMDGVIDEKDKDVTYPYNFGVLTTRSAFSCGNLFPILMQEKGAVVIDVGIIKDSSKHIHGETDFNKIKDIASYITPVPGGVGPMTIACLMENTYNLFLEANNAKL